MRIYKFEQDKDILCDRILRKLPKWFGIETAIVEYVREVKSLTVLAADLGLSKQVGFLALCFHNELHAEVYVMGVLPEFHRKRVGTALVTEAEHLARRKGVRLLSVKTLSPSRPNPEYELSRKFYESVGFRPFEEFKTLWGEGNPCLLMVKVL